MPALSVLGCAILASVVADWGLSIASNSLWMDSRISARKSLFSSLPLLVERASHALLRPIIFSDSCKHDQDDKHLSVTSGDEEQVYFYLKEASNTCAAALCAETPGLDPHSVGSVLKALRLCRKCPDVRTGDRGSSVTTSSVTNHMEAEGREVGGNEGEGEGESQKSSPLFVQFKNAVTSYALKFCNVQSPTVTSNDDVIIGNPFTAMTGNSNGSLRSPIQVESEELEDEEQKEDDNAEFSDWDEEEDTENEHVKRRGSLCHCDDLTALQDEIEMLQSYYKSSFTSYE